MVQRSNKGRKFIFASLMLVISAVIAVMIGINTNARAGNYGDVIFLGDRYVVNATGGAHWASSVINELQLTDYNVIASTGACFTKEDSSHTYFKSMLDSIRVATDAPEPDKVKWIVAVGGFQDMDRTEEEIRKGVQEFVKIAKDTYPNSKIIIGMASYSKDHDTQTKLKSVANYYKIAAEAAGVFYVDLTTAVSEVNGAVSDTELNPAGHENIGKKIAVEMKLNSVVNKEDYLEVKVLWQDYDNAEGIRPDQINLKLFANEGGTTTPKEDIHITSDTNTWKSSQKYPVIKDNGDEIDYSLTCETVAGYDVTINKNPNKKLFTVALVHKIETKEMKITGSWDDNGDNERQRPTNITIKITGFVNVAEVTKQEVIAHTTNDKIAEKTVTVPVYYRGEKVEHVISVDDINGYTFGVEMIDNAAKITGVHQATLTSYKINVIWDDNNNQDAQRPGSIGLVFTGSDGYESDITVAAPDWNTTIDGLQTKKDGNIIQFNVSMPQSSPVISNGYSSVITKSANTFTVKLKRDTETVDYTLYSVSFDDGSDVDGIRPAEVKVYLDDGQTPREFVVNTGKAYGTSVTTWKNLPVYRNGTKINYTIRQEQISGYTTTYKTVGTGFSITNMHKPAQKNIIVSVIWDDNGNETGYRPDKHQIFLTGSDGSSYSKTLGGNGTVVFGNIPAMTSGGEEIEYTISQSALAGYNTTFTNTGGNAWTITNSISETVINEDNEPGNRLWGSRKQLAQEGYNPGFSYKPEKK